MTAVPREKTEEGKGVGGAKVGRVPFLCGEREKGPTGTLCPSSTLKE